MNTEYGITWVGGCQDGNEETSWVDTKELIAMANDNFPTKEITDADSAINFLRTLDFSIEIANIPELDSAGYDSNGVNHYQEKLN